VILAAAMLAGALAPATVAASPLADRVPDVATRFCIDFLSRAVPVPAVGPEEERVFSGYGLKPGVPNAALRGLGRGGATLLARATLASGEGPDGAFVVAVGGSAGETCRIIVYRAPPDGQFVPRAIKAITMERLGWKALPAVVPPAAPLRLRLIKRDAAGKPFIANLIAPDDLGPVAMIVTVAALPPSATIPQGF
jgi:hypothetical protein